MLQVSSFLFPWIILQRKYYGSLDYNGPMARFKYKGTQIC